MTALYCPIRQHYCACSPRCDEPSTRSPTTFYSTCRCGAKSDLYVAFPICRECFDDVCPACSKDIDAESGSATCHECAAEMKEAA